MAGKKYQIGQTAILAAMNLLPEPEKTALKKRGFRFCTGSVGTMNPERIIASIETAAKRDGIINRTYREEHSLYHAVFEAFIGMCRGNLALGSINRTVSLSFAVVRGTQAFSAKPSEQWIAAALYGTIGVPIKGFEHETIGLGINHL